MRAQKKLTVQIILAITLAALSLAPSCSTPGTVIKLEPASSQVQVNDTVKVLIQVENISDFTAVELHLSFDPAVLEVTELAHGNFLTHDFIVQNNFDNSAGTIDYAIAQIDQPPASGSGTLLAITFRAKAPGDAAIRFRGTPAAPAGALLANSTGTAIAVSLVNGSLTIE